MDTWLDRRRVSIGAGALALVGLLGWAGSGDDVPPPRPARVVERRPEPIPARSDASDAPSTSVAERAAAAEQSDGAWRFDRDAEGRVVATDGPHGPTRLDRDPTGRVVERTDASGRQVRLRFDAQGRAIAFEAGDTTESLTYDARGRLVEAVAGAERLTYDVESPAPGRLRARVRDHGAGVSLDYESASGHARVESPFGSTSWHEDDLGRVVRLGTPAGAFTWTSELDAAAGVPARSSSCGSGSATCSGSSTSTRTRRSHAP